MRVSAESFCPIGLIQHPVLWKELCLCFWVTCLGHSLAWMGCLCTLISSWDPWKASRGCLTVDQHSRLDIKSCWVLLQAGKAVFLAALFHHDWNQIQTGSVQLQMLCHQKESQTHFLLLHCGLQSSCPNTLWAWGHYAVFLGMGALQYQIYIDSSCNCWCFTEFEAVCWNLRRPCQECSPSSVPMKAKRNYSTAYVHFLVLLLLIQVWYLRTGERCIWGGGGPLAAHDVLKAMECCVTKALSLCGWWEVAVGKWGWGRTKCSKETKCGSLAKF